MSATAIFAGTFGGDGSVTKNLRSPRQKPRKRPAPSPLAASRPRGLIVAIAAIFLPFVFGYGLSYFYRTVTAVIAPALTSAFALTPGQLGLLESAFFLTLGALQIPVGIWLDRFGPRKVQLVLLTIATIGTALFAAAEHFTTLLLAQLLIGIGVAGALVAGLKAIVLWFPPERLALANGCYIMIGALGAAAATMPAEAILTLIGWRNLYWLLSGLTAITALAIFLLAPDPEDREVVRIPPWQGLCIVYRDRRFWRLAPLAATVIGSAWALQGLWAGLWFTDVERLPHHDVVRNLFLLTLTVSVSAFGLGWLGQLLQSRNVKPATLFAAAAAFSMLAQLCLVLGLPIPSLTAWLLIAALGAGTVLTYASLSGIFPKSLSGRANGVFNVLLIAAVCAVEAGFGRIIELWPAKAGHYPAIAHQNALGVLLLIQAAALIWFVLSGIGLRTPYFAVHAMHRPRPQYGLRRHPSPYDRALAIWSAERIDAWSEVRIWRMVALASMALVAVLSSSIWALTAQTTIVSHVIEVRGP